MKKTLLLLFTLLLALSAQSQNSLRLMTYNIKNANGMDDVCDFQRIADVSQPENHDTSRTGRSTCADYGRVR